MPDTSPANGPVERFQTFAGTICSGMEVVSAEDKVIGTVRTVRDNQIVLDVEGEDGESFVPLGLVDGIGKGRVLLSGRGDSSFGLGATP